MGDTVREEMIGTTSFGKTDREVTIVGLGGEGILRTFGQTQGAALVIKDAIKQGITYFDSARVYAGSEGYYGSMWSQHQDIRARVFQASKSAGRSKEEALRDLDRTLATLGTEYLDLWQIHDVRTERDLWGIEGPGGALDAFTEAKASGKVRFIGVTGHHDPRILTRAVRDWPVDSVMMPVNPAEGVLGGFLDSTLPLAKEKGIAVIGMKILGAGHYIDFDLGLAPEVLICYALSQGITVAIVGCSTSEEVHTLAQTGRDFVPLSAEDQSTILERFRPYAERLAFYRGVRS